MLFTCGDLRQQLAHLHSRRVTLAPAFGLAIRVLGFQMLPGVADALRQVAKSGRRMAANDARSYRRPIIRAPSP